MVSLRTRGDKDHAVLIVFGKLHIHVGEIFFKEREIALDEIISRVHTEHFAFAVIAFSNDIALVEQVVHCL